MTKTITMSFKEYQEMQGLIAEAASQLTAVNVELHRFESGLENVGAFLQSQEVPKELIFRIDCSKDITHARFIQLMNKQELAIERVEMIKYGIWTAKARLVTNDPQARVDFEFVKPYSLFVIHH